MSDPNNSISIGLTDNFQAASGKKLDEVAFRAAAKKMGITPRVIKADGTETQNVQPDGRNLDIHIDDKGVVTDIVIGWQPKLGH